MAGITRGVTEEDESEGGNKTLAPGVNTWGSFAPPQLRQQSCKVLINTNSSQGEGSEDGANVQTWIIQEYCDKGSLSALMTSRAFRDARNGNERNLRTVVRTCLDVAKGMQYLHGQGIIHSDLKTGNVLVQSVGDGDERGFRCKVADFGLSRALEAGQTCINTATVGTVTHCAPELLMHGRLTEKADVYSFGMLMWEVHCGNRHPFGTLSHAEIVTRVIVKGERPTWPEATSAVFRTIAEKCWSVDPEARPSFDMVVSQLEGICTNLA